MLRAVVAKIVEGARTLKARPMRPYLFHLYMGQEALNGEEMVAYDIGLDLLKYDCTWNRIRIRIKVLRQGRIRNIALPLGATDRRKAIGSDHHKVGETGMKLRSSPSRRSKRCHTPSTMQFSGWSWPRSNTINWWT